MKMNNEFYFTTAKQIYRIIVSPQAKNLNPFLDRLNAAHFDFNFDLLGWLVLSAGVAFA